MTRYTVDYATLELIRQLAERQADHMRAIASYLEANTTLSKVGGAVMLALGPKYDEAREIALEGFGQGQEICAAVAERAITTRDLYIAADRAGVDALRNAAAPDLDTSGITYVGPTEAGGPGGQGGYGTTGTRSGAPYGPQQSGGQGPSLDEQVTQARRIAGAVDVADTASRRISPGFSDPFERFTLGGQLDAMAEREIRNLVPPSFRNAYEARQMARYGAGYDEAYTRFRRGGRHTASPEWVQDNMGPRAVQSGALAVSTFTVGLEAVSDVASLNAASAGNDLVSGVADGPNNTDSIDWARQS